MELLSQMLRNAADSVALIGDCAAHFAALVPADLRAAQDRITALRRHVDRYAALAAAEIAHRSRPEVGNGGMAQSAGFISPEAMLQSISGLSRPEAVKLVKLGTIIAETEAVEALTTSPVRTSTGGPGGEDIPAGPIPSPSVPPPWQAPLVAALTAGVLSMESTDAIRRALGDTGPGVSADALTEACTQLIEQASGSSPDQLFRKAKHLRDGLDGEGIERRERTRWDSRLVRRWKDDNGMHCGRWCLPPEDGALVNAAFDEILSPRRGGPRMVDPEAKAAAEDLLHDERTNDQIAADCFVAMIRLAVDADPGTLFGHRRPAVRVVVSNVHLRARAGHGRIEGQHDPVSFGTVERQLCDTGAVAVGFDDDGQCVNVGRQKRFFTPRQRIGMAVRDGGCLFPSCDRPPSWCEAHHINQWERDRGETDIADGVLLCRRHHLLLHDNSWQVLRDRATYWLRPPRSVDPDQALIPMRSRNPDHLTSGHASSGREPSPSGDPGFSPGGDPGLSPGSDPGGRPSGAVRR
ncbi:DUF222 domain-containing protein [Planctomonas psychrotolerans]|uniref:DUF222 domain-containing protein n=1 Tax=Planctomonas psychrotolerans TaxID=2528712 RepID=UPI00123C375C|nr:DUF222 domain-containing protein [Planctomonas psychrotolerans]